ncbi:hypothetical protein SEA_SKOG_97 [Gordonia phage Skog]|uniref:Uncharacterized protein n=1 Tax=Gordonia phage Skog TaxID=2704033 RepID=A0A6G6XJF7_9CAUD|nr:hypothetical protein KHQ85_gp097 [Gordonia phage Skog]QIG58249.1 hypothetical protein SEA_SKOG_97 [Gordonia phage Skog]
MRRWFGRRRRGRHAASAAPGEVWVIIAHDRTTSALVRVQPDRRNSVTVATRAMNTRYGPGVRRHRVEDDVRWWEWELTRA